MLGVVSSTVWATPRAEDLFLTWTFSCQSGFTGTEIWKVTCSTLLMFRKKLNLLKQFEVFVVVCFVVVNLTGLELYGDGFASAPRR